MSLYYTQKLLYLLNRDQGVQDRWARDLPGLLAEFDLTDEERRAFADQDVGLLYVLGVNGQLLMHYAALLGLPWEEYLAQMSAGLQCHGPVRAGIYAMSAESFR